MTTCHNCQDSIDQDEINALNKTLIFAIDSGLEEFSDLEEAMYHGMYCAKCCKEFIAKEVTACQK